MTPEERYEKAKARAERLASRADWYYSYADDGKSYKRGQKSVSKATSALKKLRQEDIDDILSSIEGNRSVKSEYDPDFFESGDVERFILADLDKWECVDGTWIKAPECCVVAKTPTGYYKHSQEFDSIEEGEGWMEELPQLDDSHLEESDHWEPASSVPDSLVLAVKVF